MEETVENQIIKTDDKPNYPLPYVYPELNDWPLAKLGNDREEFINQVCDHLIKKLTENNQGGTLSEQIAKVLYLERARIRSNPWKADPPDDMDFWSDIKQKLLRHSLDQSETEVFEHNKQLLERILRRYVVEITSNFKVPTYRLARKVLPIMFGTLLNTGALFRKKRRLRQRLKIIGEIDMARSLLKKGTVVLVPTHFSNLDSILIGWSADRIGLTALSYGAGLNLYNSRILAYFFSRLGAYTLDRRKKNNFYLEALKSFSQLTIERGIHTLFFPGGTRSRSGKLETKLKMGLLGTALDAQCRLYERGDDTKIFVIPVVLNYHFVLEAKNLIDQQLQREGKELYLVEKKAFGGFWNLMKFFRKFFSAGSEAVVKYGKPLDVLGNFVNAEGESLDQFGRKIDIKDYFISDGELKMDKQRNEQYTKRLAQRIVTRYRVENVVLSSHLVAYVAFNILRKQFSSLDLYGLLRLAREDRIILKTVFHRNIDIIRQKLQALEKEGGVGLSSIVREGTVEELIADGIKNVGTFHVKKALKFDKEGDIRSEDINLLYYYHNRLEGYNLARYIDINT